jgi:hypothetical protein
MEATPSRAALASAARLAARRNEPIPLCGALGRHSGGLSLPDARSQ